MPTLETLTGSAAEAVSEERLGERRRLHEADIRNAQDLMESAFRGSRRGMVEFTEALASSDFQAAVFDVLDREVIDRYEDITPVWTRYVSTTTVRDFRPKKLVDLLGGKAALDIVPELTEYPARDVSKALYRLTVKKYGGRFAISWEAIVNDDLDEIRNLPENLAVAARDTESRAAAALLTDGNGPNDALFNATAWGRTYDDETDTWSGGSSNLMTGNPALTIDSLATALATIKARRDPEGRPIMVPKFMLVVPQSLEIQAMRVLNTLEVRVTTGGTQTIEKNYVAGSVELVVDPWLDVLDGGANRATTWYVLPAPSSSRKALFLAHLRGHETPDLRVKADTGSRVGGGAIAPEEGSFDIDDIQYRVRHVAGTAGTDMIATIVSNGSGS
jgi:hypothetical protein